MNSLNRKETLPSIRFQIFFVAGLVVVILSLYFKVFHGGFSSRADDWGAFGDYFGGILNPVVALLALYGLLRTIQLQTKQLDHAYAQIQLYENDAKKQVKLTMISYVFNELHKQLERDDQFLLVYNNSGQQIDRRMNYKEIFGTSKRQIFFDDLADSDEKISKAGEKNRESFKFLIALLTELQELLSEFELISADKKSTRIYKLMLAETCIDLNKKKYITEDLRNFYTQISEQA